MGIIKKGVLILSGVFFLQHCAELQNLASVQKPTISVENVKVSNISLQDIELLFDLEVDNPNPLSLSLASYSYDFQINSNSFVKGTRELETEIEANGSNTLSVPVTFTFEELYNTFTSLKSEDEAGYTLLGSVGVNVPVIGYVEVPIEKEGIFPVVKAPSLSLTGVSVKNLSLTGAELEINVGVDNPNSFGLNLNSLDYEVDLNGLSPLSGTISEQVSIGQKESGALIIPVSLNFLQVGMAAYNALRQDEFEYSLNGTANLGADLPLFKPSSLNFDKSGIVNILK
ncbi:MAG: hypothetical protein ED557_02305 [Balneola sp.]|nr:MAG: hypothetical protein ED557_02305 [Balneola sp.]